jgi:hypothetical protein
MRSDVLYEMTDGVIRRSSHIDYQHAWLTEYRIEPIPLGRMCEKFPALKHSWEQFKTVYELCRSQDEIDQQVP